MRVGKCKVKEFGMYSFRTPGGYMGEVCFTSNITFEFIEQINDVVLRREGMNLYISKEDFKRMNIVYEEDVTQIKLN